MKTLENSNNSGSESENAVLGCILIDGNCMNTASKLLTEDDFAFGINPVLYGKMLDLWQKERAVDLVTLADLFGSTSQIKKYMVQLADSVPDVWNIKSYCELVKKHSLIRNAQGIMHGSELTQSEDVVEGIRQTSEKLADLIRDNAHKKARTTSEILADIYEDMYGTPEVNRTDTGISRLDTILGGIYPGDLVTIAAGTGVGKTAFMLQIVGNMATAGKRIRLYSQEMSDKQNVQRMLARISGVPLKKIKEAHKMSEKDKSTVMTAFDRIYKQYVTIIDDGGIRVSDIRLDLLSANTRGAEEKSKTDVIVIDHVGLMQPERYQKNRTEAVTEIMIALKALAARFKIPIVVLAQFNRETRLQDEPQLYNLRDSGEIEQSSSSVVLLWREKDYEKSHCIGVKVAKNRQGECGRFTMKFQPEYMSFSDIEYNYGTNVMITSPYDEPDPNMKEVFTID